MAFRRIRHHRDGPIDQIGLRWYFGCENWRFLLVFTIEPAFGQRIRLRRIGDVGFGRLQNVRTVLPPETV